MDKIFSPIPEDKQELASLIRGFGIPRTRVKEIAEEQGLRKTDSIDKLLTQCSVPQLLTLYKEYYYAGTFTTTLFICPSLSAAQVKEQGRRIELRRSRLRKEFEDILFKDAQIFDGVCYVAFRVRGSEREGFSPNGTIFQYSGIDNCVIVLRPGSQIAELRASHPKSRREIGEKLAGKLFRRGPMIMDRQSVKVFCKSFIETMIHATIDVARGPDRVGQVRLSPQPQVSGRGRRDIRKTKDYIKYVVDEDGLEAVVYAVSRGETKTRFQINFRECRFNFRAFTGESEVERLVKEVERIAIQRGKYEQSELHKFLRIS